MTQSRAEIAVIAAKTAAGMRPNPAVMYAGTLVPGKNRLRAKLRRPSLEVLEVWPRCVPNQRRKAEFSRTVGPTFRVSAKTPRSPTHRPIKALMKATFGLRELDAVRVAAVIVAPSSERKPPSTIAPANSRTSPELVGT